MSNYIKCIFNIEENLMKIGITSLKQRNKNTNLPLSIIYKLHMNGGALLPNFHCTMNLAQLYGFMLCRKFLILHKSAKRKFPVYGNFSSNLRTLE